MDGFGPHMGMGMPGMFLPGGMPGMMQLPPGMMDPDFASFSQVRATSHPRSYLLVKHLAYILVKALSV